MYNNNEDMLTEMKKTASTVHYNVLAQKMSEFIDNVRRTTFENKDFDDLSPVMSSFNQVRLKEGYVLDGFQSGTNYSTRMVLHARKKEGREFYPLHDNEFGNELLMWKLLADENNATLKAMISDNLNAFDDSMYIRTAVHYSLAEHLVRPIWKDITVPFNEEGIFEAALLFIAPQLMPGVWHAIMGRIYPVCSDFQLINRCKSVEDYVLVKNPDLVHPKVIVDSEDSARVIFAVWGWFGLNQWTLNVFKEGDTVRINKDDDDIKTLLYYNPRIII